MQQLEDTLYIVKTYYNIKRLLENTSKDIDIRELIQKEFDKEIVDGVTKYKKII